jgi:hypothetical protein
MINTEKSEINKDWNKEFNYDLPPSGKSGWTGLPAQGSLLTCLPIMIRS